MLNNIQSEDALQLHIRLMAKDKIAQSEIAEAFIMPLKDHLTFKYPTTDQEIIWDATTTALMDYIEHPSKYNPALRGLLGYLKMAAEGDLKNALARQKRGVKVVSFEDVALSKQVGNIDIEGESLARLEARAKLTELSQQQALENRRIAANELDRWLMVLINVHEHRTSEYAKILGITHLATSEQKRIVKQHKDRLKLRRKRNQSA
jgi:hypothetical protein